MPAPALQTSVVEAQNQTQGVLEGHNASGENNMNTVHKIRVYSNTYTLQTT